VFPTICDADACYTVLKHKSIVRQFEIEQRGEHMSFLGWLIFSLLVGGVLVTFWESIRNWLTTTVFDWVERHFGYTARQNLTKAFVKVDRVITGVRRRAQLFTKKRSFVFEDHVALDSLDEEAQKELLSGKVLVQEISLT
jgi:hypothetical protein